MVMNRTSTAEVSIHAVSPELSSSWAQAARGRVMANAPASPTRIVFDFKVMRILLVQTGFETRESVSTLHLPARGVGNGAVRWRVLPRGARPGG